MLISIKEINENKRYVALFAGGKTKKIGQTNLKKGAYMHHNDKVLKKKLYKKTFKRFENK
jgi:hypothetical protein